MLFEIIMAAKNYNPADIKSSGYDVISNLCSVLDKAVCKLIFLVILLALIILLIYRMIKK